MNAPVSMLSTHRDLEISLRDVQLPNPVRDARSAGAPPSMLSKTSTGSILESQTTPISDTRRGCRKWYSVLTSCRSWARRRHDPGSRGTHGYSGT